MEACHCHQSPQRRRVGQGPSEVEDCQGLALLGWGDTSWYPLAVKISRSSHTAGSCPCPFLRRGEPTPRGSPAPHLLWGVAGPWATPPGNGKSSLGQESGTSLQTVASPSHTSAPSDREGTAEQRRAFCLSSLKPLWPAGASGCARPSTCPEPPRGQRPCAPRAQFPASLDAGPATLLSLPVPSLKGPSSSPAQFQVTLLDPL